MNFDSYKYEDSKLLQFYKELLKPRTIEEKMLNLLRQGKISKWFSGIGQEAISVGVANAIFDDEYVLTLIRNLGIFTTRNVPLDTLFSQFQGKKKGFTKGRDRSFHFGTMKHHIIGMISHLGPQLAVADGIALYNKIHHRKKVTVAFTGDGGTSEGDFYEALNVAAVWALPVIFIIENNGYGLSTPTSSQHNLEKLIDRGKAFGIISEQVDGNNILEVHSVISKHAQEIREKPHPVLIEAITFRMRGHEEASGTKYVPKELFEEWGKKDPILTFENYLLKKKILNEELISEIKSDLKMLIEEKWEIAFKEENILPNTEEELSDVYAPYSTSKHFIGTKKEMRFVDAISDALHQAMKAFPDLIIMGQDIAEYGGVFKVTEGFLKEYGSDRVRNTPLCESAIIGTAMGYSLQNAKAIVEMQFADFVSVGFNQIVNNLAKLHYRWGQNADVVVRLPSGGGVGAGPYHSQSNEAWFAHTPGLKVVYPSDPYDAKGLLLASIEDPNPVMFFEHKALYRSLSGLVPDGYYTVELGKGKIVKEGNDATIITYGMGVHWALDTVKKVKNGSVEIIDLRTLLPWDKDIVQDSVRKTGRVLVLHEDTLTGGFGGEIAAWIAEHCFEYLDAPVMRVASLDTPIPFSVELENNFLASKRLPEKLQALLSY